MEYRSREVGFGEGIAPDVVIGINVADGKRSLGSQSHIVVMMNGINSTFKSIQVTEKSPGGPQTLSHKCHS